MIKVLITSSLITILFAPLSEALTLTPEDAFKESDVIALVHVLSVAPLLSTTKYTKTARVEVVEPVKGAHEKDVLDLDFDTTPITPNVLYTTSELALVVLQRLPSGHYETMHADCGKFTVEEGDVLDCNLLGDPGKVPPSVSIDEAIRKLRVLVAASKEEN